MSVLCFGLNHQSAPLDVLEQVALSENQMQELLVELRLERTVNEIAGLSTCNRTEFYLVGDESTGCREILLDHLKRHKGTRAENLSDRFTYTHKNERAARHLFRVASGIDSLVVGESEILGQLRRSYELAIGIGTAGGMLNSLLLRAITFGRKVRTRTNIGRGNVSVASIAVNNALNVFPDLADKRLLVLGAGETARLAALQFRGKGLSDVTIINRTHHRAEDLAIELSGRTLAIDQLQMGLESADLVICAVGAPHYIITQDGMARIAERRRGRPMLLLDLSIPRNIDPEVRQIRGIELITIGDLRETAEENRQNRQSEISQVESMIDLETDNFLRWTHSSETSRVIALLRRRVEETRQNHLKRYARQLDDDRRDEITRFSDSLLRSVLHDLTLNIRSIDLDTPEGRAKLDVACELFGISATDLED